MKLLHLLLLFPVLSLPTSLRGADLVSGESTFFFTSSPNSWIGQGRTVLAATTNGFEFTAQRNAFNGVSLAVTSPYDQWFLDFAAADGALLNPGSYFGAMRFPHQLPGVPGMSFHTDTRENNTLIGFFEVLAVDYGPGNTVVHFDANFLQYDDRLAQRWNQGAIRFVAVPEPSVLVLASVGLLALCFGRRFRFCKETFRRRS